MAISYDIEVLIFPLNNKAPVKYFPSFVFIDEIEEFSSNKSFYTY